jgi:hypothetical protein
MSGSTESARSSTLPGMVDRSNVIRPLPIPARIVLGGVLIVGALLAAPSGIGLIWYVPYAGVGLILAVRRPDTSIGWLLMGLAWLMVATVGISIGASPAAFEDGTVGPLTAGLAIGQSSAGLGLFYSLTILAIVFPSGRLPTGRWGAVARIGLIVGMASLAAANVMPVISVSFDGSSSGIGVPNPIAVLPELPVWQMVTPDTVLIPLLVLLVAAVASLFVRYRRAIGVERQQLRWLTAALGLLIGGVFGGFALGAIFPALRDTGFIWIGPIISIPLIPVSIGIAVLRYRLYEIDRIVSRTIGWGLTTGSVAAVFGLLIVGLQALLEPVTNASTLVVAGSTLVAAALFMPLHRRLQAAVDRRFNRSRVDAQRVVDTFAERLRDRVDLAAVESDIAVTLREALRPGSVTVWVREDGQE